MLNSPARIPLSASKGKQKDEEHRKLGWWDFVPLVENVRRPVQWSSSSLLFTAHSFRPEIVCMHFPSSKHFSLPPPHPLSVAPASYDPPTVLSVSSRSDWIFAYFPGKQADGVGALWKGTDEADAFFLKDWWTFPRGEGAVNARWLSRERDWMLTEDRHLRRLHALGPNIPFSHPVLLLVTQSRMLHVVYTHPQQDDHGGVKMIKVPLSRAASAKEGERPSSNERVDGPRGTGLCSHAAIGVAYNNPVVVIATSAKYVPGPSANGGGHVDVGMPLDMPTVPSEPLNSEWEAWRDESIIELCEVHFRIEAFTLGVHTQPLPPIRPSPQANYILTDLTFVPFPRSGTTTVPTTPIQTQRTVTPQSSPSRGQQQANFSPGRAPTKSPGKVPPARIRDDGKQSLEGGLHLVSTFVDLSDYNATPYSELVSHVFVREKLIVPGRPSWKTAKTGSQKFLNGVVTSVAPACPSLSPQESGIIVSLVDPDGSVTRYGSSREVAVGCLIIIKLPEMKQDPLCESSPAMSPASSWGSDLPFSFAVSPNYSLVCTVSSTTVLNPRTCVHPYPVRHSPDAWSLMGGTKVVSRSHLTTAIVSAVLKGTSPSDATHTLSLDLVPVELAELVLDSVLNLFNLDEDGLCDFHIFQVIGIAVDVYRAKWQNAKPGPLKAEMYSRWRTGQDIVALCSSKVSWDDCAEKDGYNLDAAWSLLGLSMWFMDFIERLMKECVLYTSGDIVAPGEQGHGEVHIKEEDEDVFGGVLLSTALSLDADASLLSFVHPFVLKNLHAVMNHVLRFRKYLGTLPAPGEKPHIAKDVIVDLVDNSGVRLQVLSKAIAEIIPEVNSIRHEQARISLASLRPASGTQPLLQKVVFRLVDAQPVDRPRLFIKSEDLVDGLLGLDLNGSSSSPGHGKEVGSIVRESFAT